MYVILGLVFLVVVVYVVRRYRINKAYRRDLESRGFIEVYICFVDGGYVKGYITKAQFRSFDRLNSLEVKPLNPERGNKILQRSNVLYMRVV